MVQVWKKEIDMSAWIDSDGDSWERMCAYCTHRHNSSGGMLYTCRRQEKAAFAKYIDKGVGNGCPDFHTSDLIG